MDPIRAIIEAFDIQDVWITDEQGNREHYRVDRVAGKLVKESVIDQGNESASLIVEKVTPAEEI